MFRTIWQSSVRGMSLTFYAWCKNIYCDFWHSPLKLALISPGVQAIKNVWTLGLPNNNNIALINSQIIAIHPVTKNHIWVNRANSVIILIFDIFLTAIRFSLIILMVLLENSELTFLSTVDWSIGRWYVAYELWGVDLVRKGNSNS